MFLFPWARSLQSTFSARSSRLLITKHFWPPFDSQLISPSAFCSTYSNANTFMFKDLEWNAHTAWNKVSGHFERRMEKIDYVSASVQFFACIFSSNVNLYSIFLCCIQTGVIHKQTILAQTIGSVSIQIIICC
jgi:hypothetical protein